ncbi:MAG: hypothetical protein KDD69_05470 [Bdellovibrionales bacterium]|nr:hypothetical protein [Bdellovibrionales bacterium]
MKPVPLCLVTDASAFHDVSPRNTAGIALQLCLEANSTIKYSGLIGESDPVQAELFAGLVGIWLARTAAGCQQQLPRLQWYTDSQVVREGMTLHLPKWQAANWHTKRGEALRHASLWRAMSSLAVTVEIETLTPQSSQILRMHRACDRASRWAAAKGERLLAGTAWKKVGRLAEQRPEAAWTLFDLRSAFAASSNSSCEQLFAVLHKTLQPHSAFPFTDVP